MTRTGPGKQSSGRSRRQPRTTARLRSRTWCFWRSGGHSGPRPPAFGLALVRALFGAEVVLEAGSCQAQLTQRPRLELADALARDAELRPHLLERLRRLAVH